MTDSDDPVSILCPGGEITFRDGTRKIRMWRVSDGGFLWEFEKDGSITPLHLSQGAMNAVLELHNRMVWCATDTSKEVQP